MTVHLDPSRPSTATGADAATRADVPSAARSLPAGLADVALASATSFVIGIDAAGLQVSPDSGEARRP